MITFDSAWRCLAIIASFGLIAAAPAQDQENTKGKELPTLSSLKLEFDVRRAEATRPKPLLEFQKKYEEQLEKLRVEMTKLGELPKVLAVKSELEGYRKGESKPAAEDFPELGRLQSIYAKTAGDYERERDEKLVGLIERHRVNLLALQKQLTQAGKLEEAVEVSEALKPTDQLLEETKRAVARNAGQVASNLAGATKEKPFENSLGMRFVPVPIHKGPSADRLVLLSVWETRVRDYREFITQTERKWRSTAFKQTGEHPAVWIAAVEAEEFCKWLTKKDRTEKRIGPSDRYRLPSDHEWSCAIGIERQEDPDDSPMEKGSKIDVLYPWGKKWPPPENAGNYLGEETLSISASKYGTITGYQDGYRETAPVGMFPANQFGLYDIGGNVGEWVEEWFDPETKERRIFRDGGWRHQHPSQLNLSRRHYGPWFDHIGFRCVLDANAKE